MTRQEAIKRIENHMEVFNILEDPHIKIREALNMAMAALREQEERRWIPVTERLPKRGELVLATDGGFVGEFYINKRGQWQRYNVNDYSLLMALDILFWMPMPEPPKEDS